MPAGALAAPTTAGARIANTATASFTAPAGPSQIVSNTVTLTVDQVVDAAIAALATTVAAQDGLTAVGFVAANPGNATEHYVVAASIGSDRAELVGYATDSDGNGAYDPAIDVALDPNALTLAAGERRTLFVLVRNAARAGGDVTVTATLSATRGRGAPGTVLTGAGDGGGDAMVGATGAQANASSVITADAATPTLWKSQTVLAPNGTARVMPGAIVTYRIEARFPGPVRAPEVTDVIPDGLDFVAGSITLDDQPLTDATGDDAGGFDGARVRVTLGDQSAAGTHTVQFKTRIR